MSNPESTGSSGALTPQCRVALHALVALVEQQIGGVEGTLKALAQTSDVRSDDWGVIKPLLAAVESGPVPSVCWYLHPDGHYYSVDHDLEEQTLEDRSYFPALMHGQEVICSLIVSRSAGKKAAVVAAPMVREGQTVGGLGASIFLEDLSARLDAALQLPEDMLYFALDNRGTEVLNTCPELVFTEPEQAGSPGLAQAARQMLAETEGVLRFVHGGRQHEMYFATSQLTGWHFALGVVTGQ